MDDENLFKMIETCVAFAVERLEKSEVLYPFAMLLERGENIESLKSDEDDHEKSYVDLVEMLKTAVERDEVQAIALLARVSIPASFAPVVEEGIRIHIEERKFSDKKIGARYLYIPYQLYKTAEADSKVTVKLHPPIPVSFPQEIFL